MKKLTHDELYEKIKLHDHWVLSKRIEGQRLDLSGYDLSGLVFELPRSLIRITLNNANLRETYLLGADLTEGSFDGADFTNAMLHEASLHGASLVKAKLPLINGSRTVFINADLRNTDFTKANLGRASFSYANLQNANFTEADLRGAIFRETDLRRTILHNAILDDAFFSGTRLFGVNLYNAKNIETIRVEWIDVGEEESIRLEGEAAREWLRQAAETGDA